jgi:hypothetical protein
MRLKAEAAVAEIKTLPLMEAYAKLDLPDPQRNLFSSPDWQRVIHRTYGLKQFCKYIEEDGRISSYFIYSVIHNFLEWKICVGSYCDYLDCHVGKPHHWHMFFEAIRREYPHYRIAIRNLKDESARQCPDFLFLSKEMHHEIDVRDDLDVIWQNVYPGFKGAYKRALAAGLKVKRCTKADLPKFYRLHLLLRKNKHKIFPQPYRFFDIIWREYMDKDQGVLFGAFDPSGRMIGAQIYLVCGDTLYYKFSTSHLKALELRPNNLLIWEGIKFAKERRLSTIDMGSSDIMQEGLIWFKTHICRSVRVNTIHHIGYAPAEYKFSQKKILKTFTKVCTSPLMPNAVARLGSSVIYPFLA